MSTQLKEVCYDLSMVWGDRTSKLTPRWTPGALLGDIREYFKESKVV